MKALQLAVLTAFLMTGISILALNAADDPLSGAWIGDWGPSDWDRNQVTVELKWDGKNLTGTVNPGPNAVELKKATFDLKSGAIHFEADLFDLQHHLDDILAYSRDVTELMQDIRKTHGGNSRALQ